MLEDHASSASGDDGGGRVRADAPAHVHGESEREQATQQDEASFFTDEATGFKTTGDERARASRERLLALLEAGDLGEPWEVRACSLDLGGDIGDAARNEVVFRADHEASLRWKRITGSMPQESPFGSITGGRHERRASLSRCARGPLERFGAGEINQHIESTHIHLSCRTVFNFLFILAFQHNAYALTIHTPHHADHALVLLVSQAMRIQGQKDFSLPLSLNDFSISTRADRFPIKKRK